ncbi:unnamed protein product, partial [Didymodactylos carnosus]
TSQGAFERELKEFEENCSPLIETINKDEDEMPGGSEEAVEGAGGEQELTIGLFNS